jgi:hypothetical protein
MEIALANELGVSRTPVRGAMARLADEGLLVYVPNKGFQVRRFNAKDVFDAFSVRANLEAMACRLIAERGLDTEAQARLQAMLDAQRELLRARQNEWDDERALRWHDLNLAFHQGDGAGGQPLAGRGGAPRAAAADHLRQQPAPAQPRRRHAAVPARAGAAGARGPLPPRRCAGPARRRRGRGPHARAHHVQPRPARAAPAQERRAHPRLA